ncbi:MAG: IS21 family transposase [Cytophagales bacterium]|nr:IS21 family transposase [Cytophagales bacterium]
MANPLDPMDLKQIITLKIQGYSNRKIAGMLRINRNTLNTYTQKFEACEHDYQTLLSFSSGKLRELFPVKTTINNDRHEALMSFFSNNNLKPAHPGFTIQHHYFEYIRQAVSPYGYTQFVEHFNRRYRQSKGSMKLDHEAGKELFIDFAGKKFPVADPQTGELVFMEVFVAILPCSQYAYVEACKSQKREDLVKCLANAMRFFGGVPTAVVPDNLKSAVAKSCKYEPEINRSLKDFARHYGCVVCPTRSYSPQDKALVENAVNLAYQRIYYPMREMTFFSLKDLNEEIRNRLKDYNDHILQRKGASRRELFLSLEKEYLKPLPSSGFELIEYRRAKVQKIGYVYFSPGKNYYSVPHRYIGKDVQLQYTQSAVSVFYNHERIATHPRNNQRGVYTTVKEHLRSTHQEYLDWSPAYFEALASQHGAHVKSYVSRLVAHFDYPEIGYKRAMGIIQLHKFYGSERLDKACGRALLGGSHSYQHIKNILENGLDCSPEDAPEPDTKASHIPQHNNIRGAQAYQ